MQLITDLVGRTLSGRYKLVARLAGGHLGEVYGARDERLDRPVAIKALKPALSHDEELVERFKEEARLVARVSHPNVVSVYDWGSDAGTFYMVMEHVPGTDLRTLLVARGSLEPAQATEIVAQVCDALSAAHARGVVHKDLKPENVLISFDGTVKVADFGIAAVAGREEVTSSGMTAALRYVSPEQALGFEASPTSDIWSAGAILAESITGRPPSQGAGPDLLERRSHEQPVPPSNVDPRIPVDLDDVVMTACALDPAKRYYEASEMASALRRTAVRSLTDAPSVQQLVKEVAPDPETPAKESTTFTKTPATATPSPHLKLRIGRIFVMLVVLSLLAWLGARALTGLLAPDEIGVPELTGMKYENSLKRARAGGLSVEVIDRVVDLERPEGRVLRQVPSSGTIEEEGTIRVVLSAGPPLIHVPRVKGDSVDLARARVKASGFEIRKIQRHYSERPRGTVIRQYPPKGERAWGTGVALVVSKGPPPVKVPGVGGMSATRAIEILRKKGLLPQRFEAYSDQVPAGLVIYTEPEAHTTLHKGDKIKVVVSLGPEFEPVTIPDVRGMKVANAAGALQGLGLRVTYYDTCEDKEKNRVVDTDPAPGTTIRENDLVTLVIC